MDTKTNIEKALSALTQELSSGRYHPESAHHGSTEHDLVKTAYDVLSALSNAEKGDYKDARDHLAYCGIELDESDHFNGEYSCEQCGSWGHSEESLIDLGDKCVCHKCVAHNGAEEQYEREGY